MLKFKKMFTVMAVLLALVLITSPILFAATGDLAEEGQSWLARQLEIYGVPVAIASTISGTAVGAVIYLVTKGLKKTTIKGKESIESIAKTLNLSTETANKLVEAVNVLVNKKVEPLLIKADNLMDHSVKMLEKSLAREDELYNIATAINKTLIKGSNEQVYENLENVKEV